MFHEGWDGGAKAPIARSVEAPKAPTTNARLEIAGAFAVGAGLAGCGATVGVFTDGEGVVPG